MNDRDLAVAIHDATYTGTYAKQILQNLNNREICRSCAHLIVSRSATLLKSLEAEASDREASDENIG